MHKITPFFLFILITFSICSCVKPQIINDDDELNFNGSDIVVYVGWHSGTIPTKKGGSSSADREYTRYRDTENEFNFVYDFQVIENPATTFLAKAISGNLTVDLLRAIPSHLYESWLIDVLLPAESVISNLSADKWKSPAKTGVGIYGDTQYGVFPNYWDSAPSITGFIQINLTILDRYNIDDPHEIIEAGEWDWTHFRNFLSKTVINDGDQIWEGMAINDYGTGNAAIAPFLLANGADFMSNDTGRWVCNINSPEAIEALEYFKSLVDDGLIMEGPIDMHEDYFTVGDRWMVTNGSGYTSNKTFDICAVRYPYGPNGNKDIVSTITMGETMWAFPIFSAFSEEDISEVVEYMFEPLSDLYPNGWKDIIEENYFFNHDDYEYFLKGIEEAEYIDKSILIDSYWAFNNALLDGIRGTQSPEIALQNAVEVIQIELDEKYNK